MNSETESAQYDERRCFRVEDGEEVQFSTFKVGSTRRIDKQTSALIIEEEKSGDA